MNRTISSIKTCKSEKSSPSFNVPLTFLFGVSVKSDIIQATTFHLYYFNYHNMSFPSPIDFNVCDDEEELSSDDDTEDDDETGAGNGLVVDASHDSSPSGSASDTALPHDDESWNALLRTYNIPDKEDDKGELQKFVECQVRCDPAKKQPFLLFVAMTTIPSFDVETTEPYSIYLKEPKVKNKKKVKPTKHFHCNSREMRQYP